MNLLKYSNKIEKTIHENSDLYIDSLLKKIQGKLRSFDVKLEVQSDTIKFKRFIDPLVNKREALKILREGQIRIKRINSNKIEIFWEVELDSLLFMSILIGMIIGLITGYASSMIIISVIIGLLFSTITYFIGCSLIQSEIDKIVETSF